MAQYHLSPNGPRTCRAAVQQCPYGAAGEEHYSTQAEAQDAYEARMADAFGSLSIVKRSLSEKALQSGYQTHDTLLSKIETAKASPAAQDVYLAMAYVKASVSKANSLMNAWETRRAQRAAQRAEYIQGRIAEYELKTSRTMAAIAHKTGVVKPSDAVNFRALQELRNNGDTTKRIASMPAFEMRAGQMLADGSRVTDVYDQGASVTLALRTPDGKSGFQSVRATDGVAYYKGGLHAGRRAARRGTRKKLSETVFGQRLRAASEAQKQVVAALRGTQATAATHRAELARPRVSGAHRKVKEARPLAAGLSNVTRTATIEQQNDVKYLRGTTRQYRAERSGAARPLSRAV